MGKKFLFIVDPLSGLNVSTDTTLAIIEQSCFMGVETFACEISDISLIDGQVFFKTARVKLAKGYKKPPAYLTEKMLLKADEFDAVFMRKDPPVDQNFLSTLFMLKTVSSRVFMFNHPDGLLLANEKLFCQSIAKDYCPSTIVSSDKHELEKFADSYSNIVLKPLFASGGDGVLVLEKEDLNFNSALSLLTKNFTQPIIMQEYIKNARKGDKRILLLAGEAIGAINRLPSEKEHRANLHVGGSAAPVEITDRDKEIIKTIKPHLLDLGLHLVGLDIIDGFLTEINVTSPTCLIEIENLSIETFGSLRTKIVEYVLNNMNFN